VEVVGDGVVIDLGDPALLRADRSGEVAEVVDRERDVGGEGLAAGLPLSQLSAIAISSRLASMRSAILSRMLARSVTDVLPHAGAAAQAASRASSMSSEVPRATSVKAWPVIGVGFSKYWPFTGATNSPPMKFS
jgi:hypothetical protein